MSHAQYDVPPDVAARAIGLYQTMPMRDVERETGIGRLRLKRIFKAEGIPIRGIGTALKFKYGVAEQAPARPLQQTDRQLQMCAEYLAAEQDRIAHLLRRCEHGQLYRGPACGCAPERRSA